MKHTPVRIAVLLALLGSVAVLRAGACPVCYGAPDSASTQGMTAAIFSLLGVTGGVLAAFAAMFLRIRRRTRAILREAGLPPSFENTTVKEAESHG
jgi:nitrate reductase gamma subunit